MYYRILSTKPLPRGGLLFQAILGRLIREGGGGGEKLYDNFLTAQSNVCETTTHFNNFNTTLNVFKCSTIYFSTIQPYIFTMFMTLCEASCYSSENENKLVETSLI